MSMLEAALGYAARGWAVLPVAKRGKAPLNVGGCRSASIDAEVIRGWWKKWPHANVGIATGSISGGLVVVDIDQDEATGKDGIGAWSAWQDEHGQLPETVEAITGRGGLHLYFQSDTAYKNTTNPELHIDLRGDGGYVVAPPSVHASGTPYEWVFSPEDFKVARVDALTEKFIAHILKHEKKEPGEHFSLPERIAEGGRNTTLFKYAASLQSRGLADDEIRVMLEGVNARICEPPLPATDIETLLESVCGRYKKGQRKHFRKLDKSGKPTGPVRHNVVAAELIRAHGACTVDGGPAIWTGDHYGTGWDEVNRATLALVPDCKMQDRKEINAYLSIKAPAKRASRASLIACANGVIDLRGGFGPMREDMVITNIVPHAWHADAYDATMDAFLNSVSAGSEVVRANLEEVVGLCMYRSNEFGVCPVLIGSGSNGKSTFIGALRNLLGAENVSSLDLSVLGRTFQAGRLLGKLANLGDDISNERLNGDVLAVFKKFVTGETIYTDVKNGAGFEFRPYCTLVFSCNEFPSLGDSSEGMLRRLFPIPFDAQFLRTDAGFDPRLGEKLCTEAAAEYLLRLGVEGIRRVIANNGMTPNARTAEIVGEVRADNDSVRMWLEENDCTTENMDGRVIEFEFADYSAWCRNSGLRPFSRKRFTRKVTTILQLVSASERREIFHVMKSVRVFRREVDDLPRFTTILEGSESKIVSTPELGI